MEIQIATLCDAANDSNGALNILGARDLYAAPQVPFGIPHAVLVVRMAFEREDAGKHDLVISILDPDGTPVMKPAEVSFGFDFPPEDDIDHVANNLIIPFGGVKFEKAGTHIIDIRCDGEIVARRPVTVLVRAQMAQPGQQPPPAAS